MTLTVTRANMPRKQYGRDDDGRQRLPVSHRGPGYDGLPGHGKLLHSTAVTVANSSRNNSEGDTMRRYNKMFNTMKAVAPAELPVSSRGTGADIRETDDYKALADMTVSAHDSEAEKRLGWSAIDAGSNDKAKKLQARVNVIARAGAGTFKTKLPKGSSVLYLKRISAEYTQQRGGTEE